MVAMAQEPSAGDVRLAVEFRGPVKRLFRERPGEVIISGPAGTGKTRGILEYIHYRCATDRIRVLMLRKTQESLKGSALVTYQEQVLHRFDGKRAMLDGVEYYGGSGIRPADFTYHQTGSKVVIGGMDRLSKVLSTEFDIIYVNECTELTLEEWEQLTGRTDRPSMMARPQSMVIGDCNPDSPSHWIQQRAAEGTLTLWESRHEDNPAMWDRRLRAWTASGQRYLDRLEKLTGVRYQRLRLGKWVIAEGAIYGDVWEPGIHLINRLDIPASWPRFWAIDFGYTNPFVWQAWATDPDGRLYRYREIYMTGRLVEDHVRTIIDVCTRMKDPKPSAIVTDHDAEDRATFERKMLPYLGRMATKSAKKDVTPGIQAVAERLRRAGDGKPRLFLLRDSLVERDVSLAENGLPTSTEEEFPSYVWDTSTKATRRKGEQPLKENDHGMDTTRYMVAHFDLKQRFARVGGT